MPRPTRIYAPGVAFHVVAVTQGRAKWFDDSIRHRICGDIDTAAGCSGHQILARTVMPNHMHIILKAGSQPLGWMMQRVLQRASSQVRQTFGLEGHVFLRRYWAEVIPTSKYLRRAIVYTHLNPCKADLCSEPSDYEFSSHIDFVKCVDATSKAWPGVMLFADESAKPIKAARNYVAFVEFCQDRRRNGILGDWLLPGGMFFGDVPLARLGDEHWVKTYTHFDGDTSAGGKRPDTFNLALAILPKIDPCIDLETLRFGKRLPSLVEPRKQLVAALLSAGCRQSAIARLLLISPNTVSKIKREMLDSVAEVIG